MMKASDSVYIIVPVSVLSEMKEHHRGINLHYLIVKNFLLLNSAKGFAFEPRKKCTFDPKVAVV